MNQYEYLKELRLYLSPLGRTEEDRVIEYYAELIGDKIESGIPENGVLSQLGTPRELADKILAETQEYGEEPKHIKGPEKLSVGRIFDFNSICDYCLSNFIFISSFICGSICWNAVRRSPYNNRFVYCYVYIYWSRYMPAWSSNICFSFGTFCSLWFVEIYTSLHKNHTKNI